MERRNFLRWAVHGLGAVFGAVIGFPAVVYLIDPRNRPARQTDYRPVARTDELTPGTPKEVVIHETRQDAWVLHPNDVVGRVWLVQRKDASDRPLVDAQGRPKVEAFTTTCPHLGCSINYNASGHDFLCPCHGAHYKLDGEAIRQDNGHPVNNPAPRNMDSLDVKLEPIPGVSQHYTILVKFEKFEANVPEKKRIG